MPHLGRRSLGARPCGCSQARLRPPAPTLSTTASAYVIRQSGRRAWQGLVLKSLRPWGERHAIPKPRALDVYKRLGCLGMAGVRKERFLLHHPLNPSGGEGGDDTVLLRGDFLTSPGGVECGDSKGWGGSRCSADHCVSGGAGACRSVWREMGGWSSRGSRLQAPQGHPSCAP